MKRMRIRKQKTTTKTGEMKGVINKRYGNPALSAGEVDGVGKGVCWLVES